MVYGDDIDGGLLGFEFEAELLLECLEEVGGRFGGGVGGGGHFGPMAVERVVGGEGEFEVELSGEAGLVDDGPIEDHHLEEAGEVAHGGVADRDGHAAGSGGGGAEAEAGEWAVELSGG